MPSPAAIDPAFLALPFERWPMRRSLARKERGATYADFRFERLRGADASSRAIASCETSVQNESIGFSVRVDPQGRVGLRGGHRSHDRRGRQPWRHRAIDVAEALARLNTEPVVLADEPAYTDTYVSSYEIDPFTVPDAGQDELSARLERSGAGVQRDRSRDLVRCFWSPNRSSLRRCQGRALRSSVFG